MILIATPKLVQKAGIDVRINADTPLLFVRS